MYTFSESCFGIRTFLSNLKVTEAERLVLFGAGGYGEALYDELLRRGVALPICFSDNDPTKQGHHLKGKPILSPVEINPQQDLVVITTISAGDRVSRQLEGLGFSRDINYFEVMQSLDYEYPFHVVVFYKGFVDTFSSLDVLHVGPGGHMGVELLLHLMGAKSVFSVEYHSFNLEYPGITRAGEYYRELAKLSTDKGIGNPFGAGVIKNEDQGMRIDQDKIHLLYPCSVTALPFTDNTFDLILHHTVFEHVPDPEQGYAEIFRVLKPGGRTVGLVDPQDHRTFSSLEHYHPLKFLEHSREEWHEIARNINFHNQITTPEHKEMIRSQGFQIQKWNNLMEMDITDDLWQSFDPMFRRFVRDDLSILRFAFSASRPE